jgi:hypothetical protein
MEQRDMQLRAALSRGGMLLRAPRPTVTTGMQDSGALRAAVRATGQIFSEEEETILVPPHRRTLRMQPAPE